ncbi:MAG TPA: hypothetical protein VIH99_06915, partial [Bdellovibrionota bacterium]
MIPANPLISGTSLHQCRWYKRCFLLVAYTTIKESELTMICFKKVMTFSLLASSMFISNSSFAGMDLKFQTAP